MTDSFKRRALIVIGVLLTGAALLCLNGSTPLVQAQSPCTADPAGPYTGTVGQTIQFDGSRSTIDWDCCVNMNWNFGDLTSGSGTFPTHVYSAPGTYTVRLQLTSWAFPGMCRATTTATITQ